jgi:hypothetical protein
MTSQNPYLHWMEEAMAMKMVDAIINDKKDVIITIIVELVERDLLGINIKLDLIQGLETDERIKKINESFVANLLAHEDRIKIKEITNPVKEYGLRNIFVKD